MSLHNKNVSADNRLNKHLGYSLGASVVLVLFFFIGIPFLAMMLMGDVSKLMNYLITLFNILEIPFFVLAFYGFYLLGDRYDSKLVIYAVFAIVGAYILFILFDSFVTWFSMTNTRWYEIANYAYFLIIGLLKIGLGAGIIQFNEYFEHYATVLGLAFILQGLISVVVPLLSPIYLILYLFNSLVYGLMILFFYKARTSFS